MFGQTERRIAYANEVIAMLDEQRQREKELKRQSRRPPRAAEYLLVLLLPDRLIDGCLGDFEERFRQDLDARGRLFAIIRYWRRVLKSVGPLMIRFAERWGLIAFVADAFRRLFS
jgi:hypothetical protein